MKYLILLVLITPCLFIGAKRHKICRSARKSRPAETKCDGCNFCACVKGDWSCAQNQCNGKCVDGCYVIAASGAQCECDVTCVASVCNELCETGCYDVINGQCQCKETCNPGNNGCQMGHQKCDGCNLCICSSNGQWICDVRTCPACPGECWSRTVDNRCECDTVCPSVAPDVTQRCDNGQTACAECNKCYCMNREWVCTDLPCADVCFNRCWVMNWFDDCQCLETCDGNDNPPTMPCFSGQTACHACNVCTCSGGHWECTQQQCTAPCPSGCWVKDPSGSCVCKDVCVGLIENITK